MKRTLPRVEHTAPTSGSARRSSRNKFSHLDTKWFSPGNASSKLTFFLFEWVVFPITKIPLPCKLIPWQMGTPSVFNVPLYFFPHQHPFIVSLTFTQNPKTQNPKPIKDGPDAPGQPEGAPLRRETKWISKIRGKRRTKWTGSVGRQARYKITPRCQNIQ